MLSTSSLFFDDECTLTLNTWGADADGSRVVASTRVVYEVPCTVLLGKPQTRIDDAPETGLRRVTQYTPATVQFDQDLGLSVHDLVAWTDAASVTHTYVVRGYGPLAGVSGAWVATCEEADS